MTDTVTDSVFQLRLSGKSPDQAVAEADTLIDDRAAADISRLLVTDEVAKLGDHSDAFGHLLASPRVRYVVCLAVGEPVPRGRILLPSCIASDRDSVVLWVADALGVDWPLSTAVAPRLRPEGSQDGVGLLIELLRSPRFFDRVHSIVAAMPNAIASPGIKLVEQGGVGARDFPVALAEAIRRLVALSAGGGHGHADPYTEVAPERAVARTLRDDGSVPVQRRRCADALAGAHGSMAALEGASTLTNPVQAVGVARAQVAEVGQSLAAFRDLVARVLEAIPADGVLSDHQRQRLRNAGAQLELAEEGLIPDPTSATRDPEQLVTPMAAVTKLMSASLRGGESLIAVSGRLAATERKLRTAMPDRSAQVESRCPAELPNRLTEPPGFPLPAPWLPVAGAVVAALAGLSGIIGAAVAALAWTGGTAMPVAAAGRDRAAKIAYLAASFVGAVAGGAAGWAVTHAARLPSPVAAGCAVIAVALALATWLRSWRAGVRAWQRAVRLNDADTAAASLADLVASSVSQINSANTDVVEALARARIVSEAITERLQSYVNAQRPTGQTASDELTPSHLAAVLAPHVVDLAIKILSDLTARVPSDGETNFSWAQSSADNLLASWIEHAREHGALAPPPFASQSRTQVASQVWYDAIGTVLSASPRDSMWQLCMPRDLAMLSIDAEPPTLPFAPALAQPVVSKSAPTQTEWTISGHRAGLLRLVPIRLGGVSTNLLPTAVSQDWP